MERWWNDIDTVKLKFSEKKPVPMPLNPPQISCGLAWDRTRACAGTTTHTDLYYEGRLISNAHSEIFCRRSKVAMLAQCVLVATTLLHSGAKFHSFLYNGSKTVRFNMESCYGGMSTRLKRRAVTEFLSAENVTPAEINRRLCFWLQIQRSRVRSPALPDFLSSSGSGTGSTQPREVN